ncbi:hypothetical protein [Rhodococcoides kyotonense]|uniref:Uncharacterized protein n=1 Tax=Rhodococcoides kyotonense TaxID=398843 RepID=A0A239IDK7_9NOCA|nr:hypothetical protein [Rhodococcus kyotonensis]SNS91645.1 hypothetical protein SAMN05421642_10710 [Rhodococcus kyotonensis]
MTEHPALGSDRERVEEKVRQWCDAGRLDGRRPPLSDGAAVALAAGRLDESTRVILAARRRAGKTFPSIGGFAAIRILADERERWLAKDTRNKPGSAVVYRMRAAELAKRLDHLRTTVVMSNKHYANGVRAVRRERRDGLHLDLDQRDALFDALRHTPVPKAEAGTVVERTGLSVLDSAADRVADASKNTRFRELGDRASSLIAQFADRRDDVFADRYEALLFLAGASYDRVQASPAWRSEHFMVQRTQLDLADELTQVAVDAHSLHEINDELDGIAAMMFDDATRDQVATRRRALDAVWAQLIDRVAALVRVADLVTRAEGELRTMDVVQKAHSLDDRIDGLVARAGNRELSADNTHFVGDQLS